MAMATIWDIFWPYISQETRFLRQCLCFYRKLSPGKAE